VLIIPAIDLSAGKCVRLLRGDFGQEIVYSSKPTEIASLWQVRGARWLHVVDLDGSRQGKFLHWKEIGEILQRTNLKVQAGGGVTEEWIVKKLLGMGLERVVVSSLAFLKPETFLSWRKIYGEKILVSLDVKGNRVKVRGWRENSVDLDSALDWLVSLHVERFIFTDIDRDGTLEGIHLEKIKRLASRGLRLIVAGGIKDEHDLANLKQIPEVEGVIIGRALLESKLKIDFGHGRT